MAAKNNFEMWTGSFVKISFVLFLLFFCYSWSLKKDMPVKNLSQRQAAGGGADSSPKKRKYSIDGEKKEKDVGGVSYEVYQSEAATFQNIGEFRKAIDSYTKVSVLLMYGMCAEIHVCCSFMDSL